MTQVVEKQDDWFFHFWKQLFSSRGIKFDAALVIFFSQLLSEWAPNADSGYGSNSATLKTTLAELFTCFKWCTGTVTLENGLQSCFVLSYLHQGIRKQKASCGRTKQNSMWEGKKLHHRLRAKIVKCVTKLLYPAWSMRSFRNGGGGGGIILTQFNFRLKSLSRYPQPMFLYSLWFSALIKTLSERTPYSHSSSSSNSSSSLFRLGILGKSSITSLRQPADFHPGLGERNERNALMCGNKQQHCVCPRGLIGEGMNLEIAKSTARNKLQHNCIT